MHLSPRTLCTPAILILILLTMALPSVAQNRIIRGTVTDDKGQPISGASVSIQALDSRSRHYDVKTDKNGVYVYVGIAPGEYRVVARAPGFAPNFVPSVRASIQAESNADIVLTPGEDQKLPFEMTAEEIGDIKKEMEKAEQRKKVASDVQALFDAGLELAQQDKHAEAIQEFEKALEKDPEQANILGYMADSYSRMNKDEKAVEIYRKAIALKPDDAALYTNMGVVLSKMGKDAESQEAFKKAAELNPAASAQNFYNIGATLFNSGRTDEAANAFRKAIAADANFDEAYYQLGMALANKPETMPEAVKALQRYVEIGKKPEQVETAKQVISALEQSIKQ